MFQWPSTPFGEIGLSVARARVHAVCPRTGQEIGTHGSSLACGDGDTDEDFRVYFMWTCLRGQRRRELERLWFETYYPVDEWVPRLRRLHFNRLIHVTELYTEDERKTFEAYNALRTLAQAGNGIDVRMRGPDGSRIMWQVNDPVDGEGWSSGQLDAVRTLLPNFRQTVHVRQTLAGADAVGAAATDLLDADGLGVVRLDARGRIAAAGPRPLRQERLPVRSLAAGQRTTVLPNFPSEFPNLGDARGRAARLSSTGQPMRLCKLTAKRAKSQRWSRRHSMAWKSAEDMRAHLYEKAGEDPAFRAQLVADPKSVVQQEFGITVPDNIDIKVHESDMSTVHLALPLSPVLEEQQLEAISAGYVGCL